MSKREKLMRNAGMALNKGTAPVRDVSLKLASKIRTNSPMHGRH